MGTNGSELHARLLAGKYSTGVNAYFANSFSPGHVQSFRLEFNLQVVLCLDRKQKLELSTTLELVAYSLESTT